MCDSLEGSIPNAGSTVRISWISGNSGRYCDTTLIPGTPNWNWRWDSRREAIDRCDDGGLLAAVAEHRDFAVHGRVQF